MNNQDLVACRELLSEEPSVVGFEVLSELIGLCPRDATDPLLHYALEYIQHWPTDITRVIPDLWVEFVEMGIMPPIALLLCNTIVGEHGDEAKLTDWFDNAELGHITHVDLSASYAKESLLEALGSAQFAGQLQTLDLRYCNVMDDGVQGLTASSDLCALRLLDLRYNMIGDDGLKMLAGASHLKSVQTLRLQNNTLTAVGLAALVQAPHMQSLKVLDVRHNRLGVEGAAALANSPYLSQLDWLYVYAADIGLDGVRLLAESDYLNADIKRYWRRL